MTEGSQKISTSINDVDWGTEFSEDAFSRDAMRRPEQAVARICAELRRVHLNNVC